jgi:hypothetical protein
MPIKLQSSSGGSVTLDVPVTASNYNVTVPNASGTAMVSGNMPAFSAYLSSNQTPSSNVLTKISFDIEDFDTNNNLSSGTFTPTVAGYYQFNAGMAPSAVVTASGIRFYKNGVGYAVGMDLPTGINNLASSCLIYCNGTTDYIEVYAYVNTGSFYGRTANSSYPRYTYFNGCLMRAA